MLRSQRFIWAACLIMLGLTTLLVGYTSSQSIGIQLRFKIYNNTVEKPIVINKDKKEKYITFLPHSGLHNQRVALINALMLAKQLDRTLLLPKINIGKAVWWRQTPASEYRLSDCDSIKQRSNPSCKDFTKYVPVSVESIFDLSPAHALGIKTTQRDDMSFKYFENTTVLRIDDNTRFSYRIYDSKSNKDDIRTFTYRLDIEDLKEAEEDVILFGSLHYTLRLALEKPELIWLGNHLREEISINHPIVIRQALRVLPFLGGPDMFIGVHLRQGDGYFKSLMDESLKSLINILEQSDLDQAKIEAENGEPLTDTRIPLTIEDEEKIQELKQKDNVMDLLNQCLGYYHKDNHPRLRLIYMATDTPQPRSTLKTLYDEFPCIFTLSDFPEIIESTLTMSPMLTGNEDIDQEMMNSKISPLLFPMIDSEITSHGSTFIGTRKSTFSQYINHRNRRFHQIYN